MPSTSLAYRALIRLGIALAPWYARTRPKVQAGLQGRAGVLARLAEWARQYRDSARPLVWMHAASAGEGRQAEAVLEEIRSRHPEWQLAFTHFSPSAAGLARELPVDVADYLPWDSPAAVREALEALSPAALCFSKLDLWPELATQARRRGTPVVLVGASVGPRSRRLRWPGRALLRPGYASVSAAGAVSQADGARLAALGVPPERIEVTGDPRFDSVLRRARGIRADAGALARLGQGGGKFLIAGSTWPEDERLLLRALLLVRSTHPEARLVLVPHEPTPEHLERLEREAGELGVTTARWSGVSAFPADAVIIVDQLGLLATLYAAGNAAYVGGGFRAAGLHSVLEPAACGKAVLFGPEGRRNADGQALLTRRAAAVIATDFPDWLDLEPDSTHAEENALAAIWVAFLRHPEHARAAGQRGLQYVEAGAGAAARNAALIEREVLRSAVSVR